MAKVTKMERKITVSEDTATSTSSTPISIYEMTDNGDGTITIYVLWKSSGEPGGTIKMTRDDLLTGLLALWPDEIAVVPENHIDDDD